MNFISAEWLPAILTGCGVVAMAMAGGLMTDTGAWYKNLTFPGWKPPDWAFGPIWTVILVLAGFGVVMAWRAMPSAAWQGAFLAILLANGLLNVLWNFLFFKIRRPDLALVEVVALWLSIAVIVGFVAIHSLQAALLFVPYLAWVGIAAVLNRSIVRLNAPFRPAGTSP